LKRPRYQRGNLTLVVRKGGLKVWVYRWREIGPKNEPIPRKQVIGTAEEYRTQTAAWQAVESLRFDINHETRRAASVPTRFSQLLEHYRKIELDLETESERKGHQTKQAYENYLRNQIEPRWGEYRPLDISAVAVEKWLGLLELANSTKSKLKYVMSDVYQHAIRYGWLTNEQNPLLAVRQSAKRQRITQPLEADEFRSLMTQLSQKMRPIGIVCATTGLRISETLGLKWSDIHWQSMQMNVTRSVVDGIVGKCKTEASRKPVPLDEFTLLALLEWRKESCYAMEDDWVFASEKVRGRMPPWADTLLDRHLQPAARRAGITKWVGFHTFRHTYSTLLQANENDVKVVQELMRHANVTTTMNVYTQAITAKKRQAQSRVVDVLMDRSPRAEATTERMSA
jgi:integrase